MFSRLAQDLTGLKRIPDLWNVLRLSVEHGWILVRRGLVGALAGAEAVPIPWSGALTGISLPEIKGQGDKHKYTCSFSQTHNIEKLFPFSDYYYIYCAFISESVCINKCAYDFVITITRDV